jgi:hypothetical protein
LAIVGQAELGTLAGIAPIGGEDATGRFEPSFGLSRTVSRASDASGRIRSD